MNDKKVKISIIISIVSGILLLALGILLMFLSNIIYFIGISFVGVFFIILLPTKIVKNNSYDIKEALASRERNLMQEVSYHYLLDKGLILDLNKYETDSDIGLNQTRIGYIRNEDVDDPSEAIYIDMTKKKFIVKYKKNKEKRMFSSFLTLEDVIKEIKVIINEFLK